MTSVTAKASISTTLDLWSKFDLEGVKRELDDKIIEIAKQLEEGDESRKRLIEQTKEFRKSLTEDQRKLVGPILKAFQVEVDSTTKRSKLMEQVLLKLYKQIIDVPDPVPSLENVQRVQKRAERNQDLEIENKKLRETLEEYNLEFAEVKNQEVTIKALKDKIKELEEKSEQQIQSKLKEREKELQKSFLDKEEQFKTNQFDLVKKLGDTEARNLSLQSQMQKINTEMYELRSKQDELLNAKSLEIDILLQDIDKLNERVLQAERLSEQYSQQMASLKQQQEHQESGEPNEQANSMLLSNNGKSYQTSALEIELSSKEKEISHLVEDIQKLQLKSNKTREFYESQRLQLEERLAGRERQIEQMEYELKKRQDYDEVKKELSILKAIEFGSPDIDDKNGTAAPGAPLPEQQLEILLLQKNRQLVSENTQIKNKLSELQIKYDKIVIENKELINGNLEQKRLIVELEKDLLRVAEGNKSIMSGVSSDYTQASSSAHLTTDSHANLLNELNSTTTIDSASIQQASPDMSLFNIVSNQRERFRVRVQELEGENMSAKQQIIFLTNEIDRLRSDNVKLYEKIKFLQSFSGSRNKEYETIELDESAAAHSTGSNVLNKYTSEYEKRLDPFSKFNYQEKQKRYTNLKLHDKFTLQFGKFILSNKLSRLIFAAYFVIIHLLIFLSLYNVAHRGATLRDFSAECANSYRDHMQHVHGVSQFDPLEHDHNH